MALVKGENVMTKKNTETMPETQITPSTERDRGKGNLVALTVRLSRADWERVHQLAIAEGISIQKLAVRGLSKVFAEKGLPAMTE